MMKWKRSTPGSYICGDWKIEGEKTDWTLTTPEGETHKRSSKKACKKKAEELASGNGKSKVSPPDSLESQLESYRLQVSGLTIQIAELTATINRLNKNLENLPSRG
jgi:predicted RNase H-like nuclease (RuvC/YqgF family)